MKQELLIVAEGPARGRIVHAQPAPATWGRQEGPPRFCTRVVELGDDGELVGGHWDFASEQPVSIEQPPPDRLPLESADPIDTPCGLLTGACQQHWPCLGAIAIEAHRQGLGLAVADHGLAKWQREELTRIGVHWIEHPRPEWIRRDQRPGVVADQNAWWKPWVCQASPFINSIWIDSDAVITQSLVPLFRLLRFGPCVSTQRLFVRRSDSLYRQIVDHLFGRSITESLLSPFASINTGVVGFQRGDAILDDWQRASELILSDPEAIPHCTVRDQTAFVVAVLSRAIQGRPTPILLEDAYNWPADSLMSQDVEKRRPISLDPATMLHEAKGRHPQAAIVHWLGRFKPWQIRRPRKPDGSGGGDAYAC